MNRQEIRIALGVASGVCDASDEEVCALLCVVAEHEYGWARDTHRAWLFSRRVWEDGYSFDESARYVDDLDRGRGE